MTPRPRSTFLALAAFLAGGWLANVLHGPAVHAHAAHGDLPASENGSPAHIGHSHCGHNHGDAGDETPSAPHGEHDCPVCDHLSMPAVGAVATTGLTVSEPLAEAVVTVIVSPEIAFVRTATSRGPPAAAA